MPSKPKMARIDKTGKLIRIGDWVKLPRSPGKFPIHPKWLRVFNRFSGRILKVVGWDTEGYAWLDIEREVLSVEPHLLTLHSRGTRQKRRAPQFER